MSSGGRLRAGVCTSGASAGIRPVARSQLARARGWTQVVLVTDASHVKRASLAFRKQGLTVAPAQTLLWKVGGATAPLRVERVGTLMHEYGGLFYYWWKGWI